MKNSSIKRRIVFSIYPDANGYGFVFMENARKLIDFGVIRINPINNAIVLKKIVKAIDYFKPSIVIILDPNGKSSRTGLRVINLIKKIAQYANNVNLSVSTISRDQIRDTFQIFEAVTKFDISQTLIKAFPELERKLPRKRNLWTSEDRNMAIFDALSLAITWYYLND
jgi:hypothetical protein